MERQGLTNARISSTSAPGGSVDRTHGQRRRARRETWRKNMPLDGTELGTLGNTPLAKLGEVERLLISEQRWCKGRLRDKDGRYCLVGALQAVEARQLLEPIILRAAREVGGKHYWRIESFNDNPHTTHADVLRVLRRARENVITSMIDPRPRYERWVQTLRVLARPRTAITAALRFVTDRSSLGLDTSTVPSLGAQNGSSPSTVRKVCEMSR